MLYHPLRFETGVLGFNECCYPTRDLVVARETATTCEHGSSVSERGCYCESNALDHKGPCHHCNIFGTYRGFLEEAERVAALADESDFRVQADVLAARCRRESLLKEVCAQIGWLNQNVE